MHAALLCWLESGAIRAAEPDAASENGWRVNSWVKRAILMGFKRSQVVPMDGCSALPASTRPATRRADLSWATACAWCPEERVAPRVPRGQGRRRHAARLCERRRLRGRGHHGGQPRARRKLRADRAAGAPVGGRPDRRRARARRRAAGHRRRRGLHRRAGRPVRGRDRAARGGVGPRGDPHELHGDLRSGARRGTARRGSRRSWWFPARVRRGATSPHRRGCRSRRR
ncbi:MAG: hypothetical protein R3F17_03410 [Planctomycetota bacterium]